ncbi:L,D-transpeptidase family protein [Novipirellula rosea]|uniref:LysM peptidoglycan-binding domain-containing protein n=1 Tax=Novipirellula rosea TaxID=1031540 RepID=A0ABP8MKW4_9BACT
MQTLKTAAIIVLLMTVMYTAYMSLTTPPDSLPPEVERIVMDEGGLDIESGLPESLGEMEINGGMPESSAIADNLEPTFGQSFNDLPAAGSTNSVATTPGPNASGVSIQLSDTHGNDSLTVHQPSDDTPAYMDLGASSGTQASLASASTGLSPAAASPLGTAAGSSAYGATDMTFDMPDPTSDENKLPEDGSVAFDPSAGPGTALAELADGGDDSIATVSGTSDPTKNNVGLANALQLADDQYKSDQRKEALETLSLFYHTPNLPSAQRQELLSRLDPLAAEVIYSRRHLLEQPHRVGHHETLMQIAVKYEVPWQLLANINGIEDPITVLPGTELKVVRGPFRADVDLGKQEMTLFLGDLYAGRFPIAVGNDPQPRPGTFTVQDKQSERPFYGASGSPVPANSPDNPYGSLWLDLGGQLCIHGSPYATRPSDQGCISVAADYADDLYGILTQGSSVTIRR